MLAIINYSNLDCIYCEDTISRRENYEYVKNMEHSTPVRLYKHVKKICNQRVCYMELQAVDLNSD